jgi:acyl transferase domain-containing protein/acyl carrier protein
MSDIQEEVDSSANFIAIVGMAGRFPGASGVEEFWRNIAQGRECISRFTPEELAQAGVPEVVRNSPDFVPARATLEEPFQFDASFFGMTPAEAAMIDPQQRLFLEASWEALEHAGYDPTRYPDLIGVYAGLDVNTYALGNMLTGPQDMASVLGNDKDYMATRVCFKLNLRGPGVTIQTACSTSLVAVQMACQSLLGYQCDMALAGGVGIAFPQKAGYLYQKGGILSPDGHCRPFDAKARGTVGGDGLGVVVLKRLKEALEAGDTVHAIIRGAAINNDGAQKMGFTAPSVKGQAEVISMTLAMADVHPESIGYVEAHGTATEMGDPVEIAALTEAWRTYTDKKGFCALGSVKSNVGHMNSAAGVGSLLKTVMALKHRQLPPSLHFESPNPMIDLAGSPFQVNTRLRPWESPGQPRRASVSSFAVGGTNAHVILEEAPPAPPSGPSRPRQLLVLSTRSESALRTASENLVRHLQAHPEQPLADVAHTLLMGRQLFNHRRMVVCRTAEEACAALPHAPSIHREPHRAPVVFLFPGQGAQHVNMARELYEQEPAFRQEVDACARVLEPELGVDLRRVLYPEPGGETEATRALTETRLAQPALFVVEYALARLWMSWGVQPEAMLGHSVGEYVAACLAGVMTRDDALRLVALRGRLVQRLPPGAMLAVPLPEEEAARFDSVSVAALNAPGMTVLSGTTETIKAIERTLSARGVACTRLHTSHAFHSAMMDPAVEQLRAAVARVPLAPPRLPYLSNVTGTWISAAEAQDPGYWARHLRAPVRFSQAVSELLTDADRLLLEVGPGRTLLSLVSRQGPTAAERILCASLGHAREQTSDFASLLEALGRLYLADVPVDWAAFHEGQQRQRVPLPTYPFERQRYFREPGKALLGPVPQQEGSVGKRPAVRDWLYAPSWKRALASSATPDASGHWLLFSDGSPLATSLAEQLAHTGARLTTVLPGSSFRPVAPDRYELAPSSSEDYMRLLEALASGGAAPSRILHTWSLPDLGRNTEATLKVGFFSVLHLAQALARLPNRMPVQVGILTSGVAAVLDEDVPCPEKATLLGLGQVLSQELPQVRARTFDLVPEDVESPGARWVERLLAELDTPSENTLVAWRGGHPWLPLFEPLPTPSAEIAPSPLREQGVYLIVGGLGGLGLEVAEFLARTVRARLVLTSRSGLLPREEWEAWLGSHGEQDSISRKLLKIRQLEALGAEVLPLSADVADEPRMAEVVERTLQRFGGLHGVIHAAGFTGLEALRAISDTTREHCETLFRPKLQGLRVLERVLPKQLDFCLLCASLASVLGGVGFAAYAAASHFMDAWAREQGQQRRGRWLSVDWDAWQPATAIRQSAPGPLSQLALRPEEGAEALRAILSSRGPEQLVVSTMDLEVRREHVRRMRGAPRPSTTPDGTSTTGRHDRRPMDTPYVAPRNALEESIAELWQGLFGLSQVGVHDNFFKLGGDSLAAIQLGTRLRDTMGVDLPINELFEEPTVAGLATRIEKLRLANQARQGAVEATLSMVENLSDEEVERMLRELKR